MASQSFFSPRALSAHSTKVHELLYRYPDISDEKLTVLVRHFRNLPLLDFGLLAADARLGAKMEAFYADHGDRLRSALSLADWTLVVALAVAGLLLVFMALG